MLSVRKGDNTQAYYNSLQFANIASFYLFIYFLAALGSLLPEGFL